MSRAQEPHDPRDERPPPEPDVGRETWLPTYAPRWEVVPDPAAAPGDTRVRWNWFGPDPAARRLRIPFDSARPGQWVALLLALGVIGVLVASVAMQGYQVLRGAEPAGGDLDPLQIVVGLVLLGAPPLAWVAAFYRGGVRAWGERLFLRIRRPGVEVALGIAAGVAMMLALIPLGLLLDALGYDPQNPVLDDLIPRLTWPLIVLIAGSAALGEELFFRGFLQPRVGIVLTNVCFGLVHLGYGVALQVIVPFALGFVFSWLVVATRSLLPAILAHFCFNFLVLGVQKLAFEHGYL